LVGRKLGADGLAALRRHRAGFEPLRGVFSPNDIRAYKKFGVRNLEWMPPKRPQLKTGALNRRANENVGRAEFFALPAASGYNAFRKVRFSRHRPVNRCSPSARVSTPWNANLDGPPHTTTSPFSNRNRRGRSVRTKPPKRNFAGSPRETDTMGNS
jgi:hypothetical protein